MVSDYALERNYSQTVTIIFPNLNTLSKRKLYEIESDRGEEY